MQNMTVVGGKVNVSMAGVKRYRRISFKSNKYLTNEEIISKLVAHKNFLYFIGRCVKVERIDETQKIAAYFKIRKCIGKEGYELGVIL